MSPLPYRVPLLPDRGRPLVFAHRGCSSLAPENTMAAFKKARELGAPGLELDVHAGADGRLVVAHDDTFIRTAPAGHNGGGKRLEELRYGEIARIDVGSFFGPAWAAERPPLLETVLEEFCPAMYVDIELKSRKARGDPLPGLLAEKLRSLGKRIDQAVAVSSFNPFCLGAFAGMWRALGGCSGSAPADGGAQSLPSIPTAVIFAADGEVPWLLRRGLGRLMARCDYLKPIHSQTGALSRWRWTCLEGRPLVSWTVDDAALAGRLTAPGPWGIPGCAGFVTNRPQDIDLSNNRNCGF